MDEPEQLLDAVAAAPEDVQGWQVLTDWLLENGAPHAVLAAYDLALEKGTRDPELLGGYAEARRQRHKLPITAGVFIDGLTWRCGYVIELAVRCELTPHLERRQEAVRRVFGAPPFRALSRVNLMGASRNLSVAITAEQVLPVLPKTVRTITIEAHHRNEPVPPVLIHHRPPKGTRLDLPGYRIDDGIAALLAGAGWKYLNLARSTIELKPETLRAAKDCVFMLGGAGLDESHARALDGDNVRWMPPGVTEALIDEVGQLIPLDAEHLGFELPQGRLVAAPGGWLLAGEGHGRALEDGERLKGFGRGSWFEYHRGSDLEGWYRTRLKR